MREHHTPLEKHLGQVPQAEFVVYAPEYHQTDHIGRVVYAVED